MFNLQHFFLTGYGSWMWAKLNEAFYRDARAEWRLPKRDAIVHWQLRSTLCGMFVQPFFSCKLLFSWIEFDDFIFFYFQETYNNQLRETYMDDPSTHLDFDSNLWIDNKKKQTFSIWHKIFTSVSPFLSLNFIITISFIYTHGKRYPYYFC
jgi:hypothetical protein